MSDIRKLEIIAKGYLKRELKEAAFEVILFNPGVNYSKWANILIRDYDSEIVDVLGEENYNISAGLQELWHSEYYDRNTGLKMTLEQWAETLPDETSIREYYAQIHAHKQI